MRYDTPTMSNGVSARSAMGEVYPPVGNRISTVGAELSEEVSTLSKMVSEMAQRFDNVMRPGRDDAVGVGGIDPRVPQSPMANSMEDILQRVRIIRQGVQDLLNRYDG